MSRSVSDSPGPAARGIGATAARGQWWSRFSDCLGWRLVIVVGVSLLLVMSLSSWMAIRLHRRHLVDSLEERATDLAETLLSSTWSSMLANDRSHLQQIITNVTRSERVSAVRLTNWDGEIRYSSRPDEIGRMDEIERDPCRICHFNGAPLAPKTLEEGMRTYEISSEDPVLGVVVPVLNAPECWSSGCHVHDASQTVLGILDVELSTASMEEVLAQERRQMMLLSVVTLLLVTAIPGVLTWRLVHKPFHEILGATRRLGQGDLGARLSPRFPGELGELAESFNAMADRLQRARSELEAWGRTLEERVEEKTRELERAQDHMVFTEKMVSLGKLAAIVAHEINNPLAGILVSVKLLRRRMTRLVSDARDRERVDETLAMVERETGRSGDIVRNLLLFSRERDLSMQAEDLNGVLRRATSLVRHQAELQDVEIVLDLADDLPEVHCDANQIEQAGIAVIMNAIEAMPDGGVLTVRTRAARGEDRVRIEISDTGVGIPDQIQLKVFEPFFTTKNEGQGTGLGLSVMYGIVQRHQGTVDFTSEVGRGTTFAIELPLHPSPQPVGTGGSDDEEG